MEKDIVEEYMKKYQILNEHLKKLDFLKHIPYVYNPTEYAQSSYECYIRKYCDTFKRIMFLGINPGPWGMSQTGVPFGEVNIVKDWLEIEETVFKPPKEHPNRPVLGFACEKSEVSGKRFWGLIKELCGDPNTFFKNCFVYNYIPLQFIDASGKNLPPTTLKKNEQKQLFEICDKMLLDVVLLYKVEIIVAIGKFAEKRANAALQNTDNNVRVLCILHPSPQSKAANNWHVDARKQLNDLGITPFLM